MLCQQNLTSRSLIGIVALFAAGIACAQSGVRLEYSDTTDDCTLFRALNGSDAVPEKCRDEDDTKSSFGPATRPEPPQTIELSGLTFDTNASRLSIASQAYLIRLARSMRDPSSAGQIYVIDGHTDRRGDPGDNLMLAARRAAAVRDYLVSLGVPAARLHARAFGATQLKDPGQPDSLVNRRVEVNNIR